MGFDESNKNNNEVDLITEIQSPKGDETFWHAVTQEWQILFLVAFFT